MVEERQTNKKTSEFSGKLEQPRALRWDSHIITGFFPL